MTTCTTTPTCHQEKRMSRPRALSSPYPHICPPPDDPADFTFKVLVIGDTCVGKTSFINRFSDNDFRESVAGTIGMDMKKKLIDVDGKKIRLDVWDTAGQERFRTLTTAFYRGAAGIIILYDVTNEASFDHVTNWLEDVAVNVSPDIRKVLVGNKCDFQHRRVVQKRAIILADAFEFPLFEASAKTGFNVDKAFENLARQMLSCYQRRMSTKKILERPFSAEKLEYMAKKKTTFTICSC
ncbi:ras-related protein Rab-13-like [Diadema setosum]|uniref:ras-related protein Rab-13-like n=1 Tax=Diadema setosum TaxID=31175 RepID=UPI003B3BCBAF